MTAIWPAKLWDWVHMAWGATLGVISLGLIVVGAGIASAAILGPSRDTPLLVLPLFIAFNFLGIFVHEMGHAIAAWSVGRRVHLIVVGPIAYRVKLRKFAASSSLEGAGRRWGGLMVSTPPPGQDWNRGRTVVYAAGSLANFAAGALAIVFGVFVARHSPDAGVCAGFALSTVSMGTYNLIPVRLRRDKWTDGGKLLQFAMGMRMSVDDELATRLAAFRYDGTAQRDWDPQFVRALERQPDATDMRVRVLLSYYLSVGDVVRAHDLVERIYPVAADEKGFLAVCWAFLVGIVERDAEKADSILAAAPRAGEDDSFGYLRAEMVIAGLRGDWDKADAAVAKAREVAAKGNAAPDRDDEALFSAIVNQRMIPRDFSYPAAS